jgi:hypothetical protein
VFAWAKNRFPKLIVFGGACALPAALVFVYAVSPEESDLFPKCFMYLFTGLHCPGCGATRAVHALLHGQWEQAVAYNALFVVSLPFLGWYGIKMAAAMALGIPFRTGRFFTLLIVTWLSLAGVFGVVRNLPVEPFTFLAPHRL